MKAQTIGYDRFIRAISALPILLSVALVLVASVAVVFARWMVNRQSWGRVSS